jgi:hypothetical protein
MAARDSSPPEARSEGATTARCVSLAPDAPPLDEARLRAATDPARGEAPRELPRALALTLERHGVDFRSARARAGIARGHLIDIVLELPGGRADAAEHAAADTLLDCLLGEARFDDWVDNVTVSPAPRGGTLKVVQARSDDARFFPLAELASAIDAAIGGIHAGLPASPLWSLGGEQRWFLLELDADPEDAPDDVLLVSTCMPELLKSYLSGAPFASTRFSRVAELFAFLRYESRDPDVRRSLARRRVLEDALDAALVSERAGRVIGGGMGVGHSHVHFALDRVAAAVALVRDVAARIGVPALSSSLCFCDRTLAPL